MADSDGEKPFTVRLAENGVSDAETMKAAAEAQATLHRDRDTLEILLENVDLGQLVNLATTVLQKRSEEVGAGAVRTRQPREATDGRQRRSTEERQSPEASPNRPAGVEEAADGE